MKEIVLPDDGGERFDPDLEARLLALIMGEASPFEAEALEKLMRERPEVDAMKRRLEAMHGLLDTAVNSDEAGWKLSAARRARVMKALGIGSDGNGGSERTVRASAGEEANEARIQRASRKVMWAAAACLMINVVLFGWLIGHLRVQKAEFRVHEPITVTYDAELPSEAGGEKDEAVGQSPTSRLSLRRAPVPPASPPRPGENRAHGRDGEMAQKGVPSDRFRAEPEPAERSRSAGRAIASQTPAVTEVPVPEVDPNTEFGSGDDFGAGWGTGGRQADEKVDGADRVISGPAGSIVSEERARRSGTTEEAKELLLEGREAYAKGNYEEAVTKYRASLNTLPGGVATESLRNEMQAHLADGTVAQAQQMRRLGQYDEARTSLEQALTVDPDNPRVREELENLDDPIRANSALEYEHTKNVDDVRRNLYTAEGYSNLGLYDQAIEEYNKALRIDPDNSAARRGMERIHSLRSDYYRSAYDEARAALLSEVDAAWEMAVPPGEEEPAAEDRMKLAEEDAGKGTGLQDDIVTRRWSVGRDFIAQLERAEATGADDGFDPFGDDGDLGGTTLKPRRPVVEVLKELGLELPPGASVQYLPGSGELIVSNTAENLDLIDQLAESLAQREPQAPVDPRLFRRRDEPVRAEVAAVEHKLKNIVIPHVDFDETTVEDAIDFLRQRSRELDSFELGPGRGGLSFRIRKPEIDTESGAVDEELEAAAAAGALDPGQARVRELKLRNVPLGTVLQYICEQARLRYRIGEDGIELLPLGSGVVDDIVTRTWEVHPDVVEALRDPGYEMYGGDDPFGSGELMTEREEEEWRRAMRERPLEEILMECGIAFPPGASVRYQPDTGVLIATNTPANNELVDQLFEVVAREQSQKTRDEEVAEAALEMRAGQERFSTFSLHVSDVSFKLAKAALDNGEWPAAGQIRVEEFVNAFDYGDPMPRQDEKVACRIEQAVHPFLQQRNLLRVSMRTAAEGRAGGVPLSLTVLLDHSGSMDRFDRAESVRRAFELLAMQLNAGDQVTLIGFARTARLLADRIPGSEAATLAERVAATPSGGGTNLEVALRLGLEKALAQKIEGGQNRIVLLTDGAANLGNARPEDLATVVERMRQLGIAFDACGVGAEGFNDEILESLTRKGDGRYYFLDRPEDADEGFARQIAGALRPAARNVKVQVEFNPRRVDRYKLYGFEKHLLEKEDFRNDSVDAAELAAAEAGNAVYHVQVLPEGEGAIGSVSVRFQDVASGAMVERRWTIPYDERAPRLTDASPSMKLAGSAALVGEKLNGSELGERVRLGELSETVNSLQLDYPASERVREFVGMVRQAREVE